MVAIRATARNKTGGPKKIVEARVAARDNGVKAIENLMSKKGKFDYILLETTGLADPGPIASIFWLDEELCSDIYLDGIVVMVDAKYCKKHLHEAKEDGSINEAQRSVNSFARLHQTTQAKYVDKLSQQAIWQHLRRSDSSLGNVHYDDRIQMTPQSGLVIKGADVADAGQYSCLHLGDYVAIYQVDVLPKERRKRVRLGESLLQEVYLPSHNLRVLTVWSSWGSCDACDVIGHRQRTGTCTVLKIDPDDRVKPRDFPMIDLYPDGVPCRSTALPGHLRRLKVVRHRYEETLVAECNVSCPTEAPPVAVTDSDGKVLELVEPVKLYSLGEMPPLPKMVKRRVLYEPEGKHLVLTCGSETQRGAGLRWMRGKRRVDPMSIKRQTLGRVWIDSANRLHLKDLMLSDTAVYNCWERELHVAAIKVLVISAMNEKLKDYITITGFVVTCIGSLVACCCLMRRGQTAR
nr:hypothetical protein BaRGS_008181 [Batillaria attramentaria]